MAEYVLADCGDNSSAWWWNSKASSYFFSFLHVCPKLFKRDSHRFGIKSDLIFLTRARASLKCFSAALKLQIKVFSLDSTVASSYPLHVLERYDPHFVHDERIVWSYVLGLFEELLCESDVIREAAL
jgi:hypothetical protein